MNKNFYIEAVPSSSDPLLELPVYELPLELPLAAGACSVAVKVTFPYKAGYEIQLLVGQPEVGTAFRVTFCQEDVTHLFSRKQDPKGYVSATAESFLYICRKIQEQVPRN